MRRNQINPGETYVTRLGEFLLEVDALVVDEGVASVIYTCLDTGGTCQCTLAEFAGRVERQADLSEPSDPLITRIR